nr:DUF6801 domain-containing protein [Actinocrispum wychmicini]
MPGQSLRGTFGITFPDSVKAGEKIRYTGFSIGLELSASVTDVFRQHSAVSVDGGGKLDYDLTLNTAGMTVTSPGSPIPQADLPATGPVTVALATELPALTARQAGSLALGVGSGLDLALTPRLADGTPTDLGTVPVSCALATGQDPSLATTQITAAAAAKGAGVNIGVTKSLIYKCTVPLVGPQNITKTVNITFPDTAGVREKFRPTNFTLDVTVNSNLVAAFRSFQAKTMEGFGVADIDVVMNGLGLTVSGPSVTIPKVPVPQQPGSVMRFTMTADMPALALWQPGSVSIAAGRELNERLTFRKEDGSLTALGQNVLVPCTQNPGQDNLLATIPITN